MRKIKNIDCGKLKIIFIFSYFISEIPNLSYMRLFRKGSVFRRSIPLRYHWECLLQVIYIQISCRYLKKFLIETRQFQDIPKMSCPGRACTRQETRKIKAVTLMCFAEQLFWKFLEKIFGESS